MQSKCEAALAVRALGFDGLELGLERGRDGSPLGDKFGVALQARAFGLVLLGGIGGGIARPGFGRWQVIGRPE